MCDLTMVGLWWVHLGTSGPILPLTEWETQPQKHEWLAQGNLGREGERKDGNSGHLWPSPELSSEAELFTVWVLWNIQPPPHCHLLLVPRLGHRNDFLTLWNCWRILLRGESIFCSKTAAASYVVQWFSCEIPTGKPSALSPVILYFFEREPKVTGGMGFV